MDAIAIILRAPLSKALSNREELRGIRLEGYRIVWDYVTRYASNSFVNLDQIRRINRYNVFPQNYENKTDNIDYFSSISDIRLIDYAF